MMTMTFPRHSFVQFAAASLWFWTAAVPILSQAPGAEDLQVLPQVFSLDEDNSTEIYVQNVTDSAISVGVEFFTQDGVLICVNGLECPVANFEVAAFGTLQFPRPPRPFVGSATVFCTGSCVATASWSFKITADEMFEVGVVPQLFGRSSVTWGSPIPAIAEGSAFGLAVYNTGSAVSSCSVVYYDSDGMEAAQQPLSIPPNAQIALFAQGIGPGFSGSSILSCDSQSIATGIIQNTFSGFPTSLNYAPLSVPSAQP